MIDRFLDFVKENKLIQKNDRILVGVSGGIDSVVLLDILSKVKEKMSLKIGIVHVNYGLRTESDRDNKFVKTLAKKYEVPFFEKKVKLSGGNIEEKARDIRYEFFNEIAKSERFNKIAVAHHKNDLAETFFLNLSRGSGLTGMVSMKPKSGNLIRPLLFTSRKEIEGYAKNNNLKFVEDVTNKDLSIKRNLVRHKIIPELEKNNPDFVETLVNEVEHLRELEGYISKITDVHYKKLAKETKTSVLFSVQALNKVNPYIQSEILRKALHHIKSDLRDISRRNIEDSLLLTKESHGTKEIYLPSSLIVRRTYDKLEITKESKSPMEKPKITRLEIGKEVFFGKWQFSLEPTNKKNTLNEENLVFLDIQKTHKLLVRCRKPGDRMEIGRGKTKSLQDMFVDAKIPKNERDTYPIVVTEKDGIVWIPGIRLNPRYNTNEKSEKVTIIKINKEKSEEE